MKWYQSRTNWFNFIMVVIGFLTYLQGVPTLQQWSPLFGGILVLGNLILRNYFTSTPIQ